jgi:hypothetical protein
MADPLEADYTVTVPVDINNALRGFLMQIRTDTGSVSNSPLGAATIWSNAVSLIKQYIKSSWGSNDSFLSDSTTTDANPNKHPNKFYENMVMLLALLFKGERTKLPAFTETRMTTQSLLPPNSSPIAGAITAWLSSDEKNPITNHDSLCSKAFVDAQLQDILGSVLFQNRYNVHAKHDFDTALVPTATRVFKRKIDYEIPRAQLFTNASGAYRYKPGALTTSPYMNVTPFEKLVLLPGIHLWYNRSTNTYVNVVVGGNPPVEGVRLFDASGAYVDYFRNPMPVYSWDDSMMIGIRQYGQTAPSGSDRYSNILLRPVQSVLCTDTSFAQGSLDGTWFVEPLPAHYKLTVTQREANTGMGPGPVLEATDGDAYQRPDSTYYMGGVDQKQADASGVILTLVDQSKPFVTTTVPTNGPSDWLAGVMAGVSQAAPAPDRVTFIEDNSKLYQNVDDQKYCYLGTVPGLIVSTAEVDSIRYTSTENLTGKMHKKRSSTTSSGRESSDMAESVDLAGVARIFEGATYYQYSGQVYKNSDFAAQMVYSVSTGAAVGGIGSYYCLHSDFKNGYLTGNVVGNQSTQPKIWRLGAELDKPTSIQCKYKSSDPGTQYVEYKEEVHRVNATAKPYHTGPFLKCFSSVSGYVNPVDRNTLFGTSHAHNTPVVNKIATWSDGILTDVRIFDKDKGSLSSYKDSSGVEFFSQDDVYTFPNDNLPYPIQHRVEFDSAANIWKGVASLNLVSSADGKRTWSPDTSKTFQQNHVIGGVCKLEKDDIIGIVVNMYTAEDSSTKLGKELSFRLFLQQI